MATSIVLLAYKEEENLRILLPQIMHEIEKQGEIYEIIVVDTAKPLDHTGELCEEMGVRYVNQRYPHFGGAFRTGIEEARYDKFLILDSDGSHHPRYISDLFAAYRSGADIVIGSRYVKGGENHDAKLSVLMSRVLNQVFRLAIGIKAHDISTDYRLYNTAQLKEVTLTCENYDVLQEVLLKLRMNNPKLVIKEVPISFDKRMFGESKRRLLPFVFSCFRTLCCLIGLRITARSQRKVGNANELT